MIPKKMKRGLQQIITPSGINLISPKLICSVIEQLQKQINNDQVTIKTFDLNLEDEAFADQVMESLLNVIP